MEPYKIKVEVEVTKYEIAEFLITALEGGSNYWYVLGDLSVVNEAMPKEEYPELTLTDRIIEAVLEKGVNVEIFDVEEPETKLGDLNLANIQRGIEMYSQHYNNFDTDDMDSGTADVFLQYAVLGEITFG